MMRKLLLLLLLCGTSGLLLAQGVPELMYYKFDGTGTAVANFASSPVGTNPATIIGGQTQGPTGQFGNALIGTGGASTADFVDTGWPTNLTGDWTISFWTSNIQPSTTLYYIFGDPTAGNFRCFTNGVAGAGNWILRGTGIADVTINGGATVAPHVMHYVYDNSVPEIRAYLDGVLVSTVPQAPITVSGAGPFRVGAATSTGLAPGGLMDEFRMYSRALTAAEISATWNQSLPLVVGPKDLSLNGLISPTSGNAACFGAAETVEVSLFNFGTDTVKFPADNAQITINATGVNPQSFQTTLTTGFLEPGGNMNVVMSTNYNMSAGGTYTFDGYVEFLTGGPDANLANDTMATSNVISSNAVVLPGQPWVEDFETFIVGNPGTLVNGWTRGNLSPTNVWNVEDATGANENSSDTGPFFDNTNFGTPGGIYMFIETSGGANGSVYDLISPCIDLSGVTGPTLEYAYHMYGSEMGYLVTQVLSNGTWITVDSLQGQQQTAGSDAWGIRSVSLGLYAGQVIQIRFIGEKGSGFRSDASIDDVTIFEPAPHDLIHAGTTNPTSPACSFTASEPVTIDIQNVGSSTLNLTDIEATYTITGPINSGPVTETLAGPGTLAPGATFSFTFTATADLSTPGLYTIASGVNFTAASGLIDPALALNVDTLSVQPGLIGTYTIDGTQPTGGTNYQTFSEAAADLATFGLCGPVVFNVQPGTYTDQLTIPQLIGSNATNTVTFDGGTNAPVLTYDANATEQATVLLSGADYITFTNMTVENQNVSEGWGFLLTQNADHNTIDNVIITLNPSATFDVAGVVASSSTINDNNAGQNASYLTVSNCTITGGEKSITLEGNEPLLTVGHTLLNNVLTGADDFGIEMDDQDSVTVIGNQVSGIRNTQGDGIFMIDVNHFNVQENSVSTNDWGFYVLDGNDGISPTQRSIIANNMMQSNTDYGAYLFDIESTDVFGNSFSGNVGLRINDPISVDVRSNIANGTGSFAIWLDDGYLGIDSLDYNLYNAGGNIANLGGLGSPVDLVAWQTAAPGANVNSLEGNPDFVSTTDLHIAGTLPNNVGDPSTGLLTDIDGDARSATTPDIGADEFTPLPTDLGAVAFVLPISGCGLQANNAISIQIRNFGTDTAFTFDLSFRLAGVVTTETFNDTLLPGQTKTFTFTATADLSTVGATYVFDGWPTLTGDTNTGNDSIIGYNVEHFNAISSFPYIEDFDNPGGSLPTGWIQQADDSGQDWLFDNNGTPTGGTGPAFDHTTGGSGFYAYVEDTGFDGDSVTLITPCFDVSGLMSPKFSFWYHSNNSQGVAGSQENEMHIDLIYNGTITYDFIPPIVHKDNNWNLIELNMAAFPGVFAFRFRVNNNNGNGSVHDIAIDDVSVVDVLPQDVGVTALLDPIGGCGLLANDTVIVQVSNLGTDSIKGGFDVSFQLDNGTISTISIPDTILPGNSIAVPFFPVDLSVPGPYNITSWTSGLAGDTNLGNDTLMEVIISEPASPLPFVEDFETYTPGTTTFLEFANDPNAQIDWEVNSGGTGSTGTGPNSAFEGANYIYMETSGPPTGAQAILRSNCIDLTNATNPSLFYAYHMFGAAIGFLSVDVEANSGITNVANWVGPQQTANGDPWKLDTVDLSPWLGQSIRIIFTGERGNSFTSDISIDAINIRELVDNDMGALAVLQPGGTECNSDSAVVEIQITNTGVLPQVNIPVTVNYSGAASGTITTTVPGPVNPGDTLNVVVGTVNTNVGGTFNFTAFTDLGADAVNGNDTIFSTTDVTVRPPAPTAVMDTIVLCTPDSTVASVINDTAYNYIWFTDPVGGIPVGIDTADFQTGFLTNDTTLYVEAITAGSVPLIKITEAELQGPDYLEVQNTGNTPVDVTGWTVAIGEDGAANINVVEVITWTMNGVMQPGEIRQRADNAAAGPNFWGGNILWNGGAEGWIVLLDANNVVIDVMFFNYSDADIQTFAPTINGVTIDITGQWSGPGIDVSSPVTAQNVYRVGTFDNNDATDWATTATANFGGQGTQNPGLGPIVTGGGGSGACPSEPRTPIHILVAPPVPVDLGADVVSCAGLVLDASNPSITSYLWNTGDMTSSIVIDTSGTYFVDVLSADGCSGVDSINVTILPSPIVDLGPDSIVSCGPTTLDAGNPGSVYTWNVPGQVNQQLPVTASGTYFVTVDINGCTSLDSIYVEVLAAPSLNLGGTISSCDDVTLDALNPGATYAWSTGATSQTITLSPPATGADTITVTVTNPNGCDITETVIITPGVDPVVDLGADLTACDSVLLDAGNPGASYAWSTGETTQTIYATNDGNYTVTVTDPTGCESTDDINVTLEFTPVAAGSTPQDFGYTYDFTNQSTPGASVVWDFGDGSPTTTDPNPTHVYAFDGSYTVTLIATNNCGS
ncbi:MAG: LamG-like jellyroll fold domain-containing protein, partial [Bacteroidota bacterium]